MQTRLEAVLWLTVIAHNILVLSVGCWPIPQSQLSLQLGFKHHLDNSSWDIPEQREALLSLYTTTNGSQWVDPAPDGSPISANESWSWGSRNTSYCRCTPHHSNCFGFSGLSIFAHRIIVLFQSLLRRQDQCH